MNRGKSMKDMSLFELTIISDLPSEPFLIPSVNRIFEQKGIRLRTAAVHYDGYDSSAALQRFSESNGIVVFLNFENSYPGLLDENSVIDAGAIADFEFEKAQLLRETIRKHSDAPVLWFGYEDLQWKASAVFGSQLVLNGLTDKINAQIRDKFDSEITFIDTKHVVASIGILNAYSNKNKYRWNYPYSQLFSEKIGMEIYKQYLITHGISKKCIVLDCDNVLWGGILLEDGIENIKLGSSGLGKLYRDFQRFLLMLHNHGVILAVCSKNEESDVLRVFREHSEMILREEHIACFQANWKDKPGNIRKIAEMLNIGLDSMVFVDDSSAEIEAVRVILPEVTTILFNRDIDYKQFSCFNLKNNADLDNIKARNETYRTNVKREKLKETFEDYHEYIKALDVHTEIHKIIPIEYSRVSELTQRTNKCTNGKRFTVEEIRNCIKNDGLDFYTIHVSDRFSNLGLVGAFAVKGNELVLFSLSCRALGREIENIMLKYIILHLNIEKVFFHSTGKNADLKGLLKKKISPIFIE